MKILLPSLLWLMKITKSCKMLRNKWYHAKLLSKRFHLNGNTIAFRRLRAQLFSLRKERYAVLICSFCECYTVGITN